MLIQNANDRMYHNNSNSTDNDENSSSNTRTGIDRIGDSCNKSNNNNNNNNIHIDQTEIDDRNNIETNPSIDCDDTSDGMPKFWPCLRKYSLAVPGEPRYFHHGSHSPLHSSCGGLSRSEISTPSPSCSNSIVDDASYSSHSINDASCSGNEIHKPCALSVDSLLMRTSTKSDSKLIDLVKSIEKRDSSNDDDVDLDDDYDNQQSDDSLAHVSERSNRRFRNGSPIKLKSNSHKNIHYRLVDELCRSFIQLKSSNKSSDNEGGSRKSQSIVTIKSISSSNSREEKMNDSIGSMKRASYQKPDSLIKNSPKKSTGSVAATEKTLASSTSSLSSLLSTSKYQTEPTTTTPTKITSSINKNDRKQTATIETSPTKATTTTTTTTTSTKAINDDLDRKKSSESFKNHRKSSSSSILNFNQRKERKNSMTAIIASMLLPESICQKFGASFGGSGGGSSGGNDLSNNNINHNETKNKLSNDLIDNAMMISDQLMNPSNNSFNTNDISGSFTLKQSLGIANRRGSTPITSTTILSKSNIANITSNNRGKRKGSIAQITSASANRLVRLLRRTHSAGTSKDVPSYALFLNGPAPSNQRETIKNKFSKRRSKEKRAHHDSVHRGHHHHYRHLWRNRIQNKKQSKSSKNNNDNNNNNNNNSNNNTDNNNEEEEEEECDDDDDDDNNVVDCDGKHRSDQCDRKDGTDLDENDVHYQPNRSHHHHQHQHHHNHHHPLHHCHQSRCSHRNHNHSNDDSDDGDHHRTDHQSCDHPDEFDQIDSGITGLEDIKQRLRFLNRRHTDSSLHSSTVRPSKDEVKKWSKSFRDLMSNRYGSALFRAFLCREYSEENIEFWLACEEYRKIRSSKLRNKAKKIYANFVAVRSPREVNLDHQLRLEIQKNLSTPTKSTFDIAQKKIQCLLESDAYVRFLQSELYTDLVMSELNRKQCKNHPNRNKTNANIDDEADRCGEDGHLNNSGHCCGENGGEDNDRDQNDRSTSKSNRKQSKGSIRSPTSTTSQFSMIS